MTLNRRDLSSEQGISLLESALSMVLLVAMLFGTMLASMMLYTYHYLSYAARLGARYAMVRGAACDNTNGMPDCPNVTSTQVQTYVRGIHFAGINSSQVSVTATWPQGNNNPGSPVQVTTRYPFQLLVPFVRHGTVNMHSTSQVVISQ